MEPIVDPVPPNICSKFIFLKILKILGVGLPTVRALAVFTKGCGYVFIVEYFESVTVVQVHGGIVCCHVEDVGCSRISSVRLRIVDDKASCYNAV